MARDRIAYVHLGAHKTGTTSIQSDLRRNRKALIRRGIHCVPRHLDGRLNRYFQRVRLPWWRLLGSGARVDAPSVQRRLLSIREALMVGSATSRRVVVSDEDLLGAPLCPEWALYPNAGRAARMLRALFDGYQLRVILYVRDQAGFIESCYLHAIQRGYDLSFEDFLGQVRMDRLSWVPVVASLSDEVGASNVAVRHFDQIKRGAARYSADFFELFTYSEGLDIRGDHRNAGLSAAGLQLARAYRPMLSDEQWPTARRFLTTFFSSRYQPKARLLDASLAQHLRSEHHADTQRLLDAHGGNRWTDEIAGPSDHLS